MLNLLHSHNLDEFRNRFGRFHDAVIHQISYELFSPSLPEEINVFVGTRDIQTTSADDWVNVHFKFEGIKKFLLNKGQGFGLSIIFNLNIGIFDNEIRASFFPRVENPESPLSYEQSIEGGADLIIICKRCLCEVLPYQERS